MRVATTTHTRSMCRRWQALAQKIDASAKAGIKYPTFISARIISNAMMMMMEFAVDYWRCDFPIASHIRTTPGLESFNPNFPATHVYSYRHTCTRAMLLHDTW